MIQCNHSSIPKAGAPLLEWRGGERHARAMPRRVDLQIRRSIDNLDRFVKHGVLVAIVYNHTLLHALQCVFEEVDARFLLMLWSAGKSLQVHASHIALADVVHGRHIVAIGLFVFVHQLQV